MKLKFQKVKNEYISNYMKRTIISTYILFFINLTIGISKVCISIYYSSFWIGITGGYYIVLSFIRGYIVSESNKIKNISDGKRQYYKNCELYHRSGFFIVVLGILYLFLCIRMYCFNEKISFPFYILYGVAGISFYKIGICIYGLFKIKEYKSLSPGIIKIVNLLDACVSIVTTQCALLTSEKSIYASTGSALLGIGVSVLFMVTGYYLICKKFNNDITVL